ncbi:transporter [Raoultibacter phocaeensis]|uniref:transporter n=1 Tax=Raoultibacter phocaeensis TaxID=2479841 RepID=UPI00111A523D|nr:transporter [Raoultibacter phocaeensis]
MNIVYNICIALSVGLMIGFSGGIVKISRRPAYTEKQIEKTARIQKKASNAAKYLTFFMLALGLVWCVYYLVLGAVDPAQVEYATGMSQLIVSVLTIISISFAFFEFLRKK